MHACTHTHARARAHTLTLRVHTRACACGSLCTHSVRRFACGQVRGVEHTPCRLARCKHAPRRVPAAGNVPSAQDDAKGGALASTMLNGVEVVVAEAVASLCGATPRAEEAPERGPPADTED
jgi:hypothetical protein